MTRMVIVAAAVVLALASLGRAEEPCPRADSPAPSLTKAAAPVPTSSCCSECCSSRKRCSLLEWLCYRPIDRPGLCGCPHRADCCCRPSLYAWFLDYCQAAGGTGHPLRLASPCASGCHSR